jgi:hypothetical protein
MDPITFRNTEVKDLEVIIEGNNFEIKNMDDNKVTNNFKKK